MQMGRQLVSRYQKLGLNHNLNILFELIDETRLSKILIKVVNGLPAGVGRDTALL